MSGPPLSPLDLRMQAHGVLVLIAPPSSQCSVNYIACEPTESKNNLMDKSETLCAYFLYILKTKVTLHFSVSNISILLSIFSQ